MKTKELGMRIKAGRISRGMTQSELAEAVQVSPSTVAMWEGGRREPNLEMIEWLADVFNVPLSYFLANDPDAVKDLSDADKERLEALHQNPKLGMLFDRSMKMSHADVEAMIAIADRILKERDED